MRRVLRFPSFPGVAGIRTDSINDPSPNFQRNLRVVSSDRDGLGGTQAKAGGEGGAERKREVGHLIVRGDEALEDPGANLFFAVGLVWGEVPLCYRLIEEEGKHFD